MNKENVVLLEVITMFSIEIRTHKNTSEHICIHTRLHQTFVFLNNPINDYSLLGPVQDLHECVWQEFINREGNNRVCGAYYLMT